MRLFDFFRKKSRQIDDLTERLRRMENAVELLREAVGRVESRQSAAIASPALRDHEFQVFSQWGEDGIIDHLVRHVNVPKRFFVEFGVETYREANTRYLLTQQGWSGLVMDGSEANIASLKRETLYWRHHLGAVAAFITRENINDLLAKNGAAGEIGLLSIDVDGNDFWIWEAITVTQPAIVVMEYNALFGAERSVTIPYDAAFYRGNAHWSHLYMGASLKALERLGQRKGYVLVGTNRAGNNAFFVQQSRLPSGWKALSAEEAFTPAQFRESRDEKGRLTYLPAAEAWKLIEHLPLTEIAE